MKHSLFLYSLFLFLFCRMWRILWAGKCYMNTVKGHYYIDLIFLSVPQDVTGFCLLTEALLWSWLHQKPSLWRFAPCVMFQNVILMWRKSQRISKYYIGNNPNQSLRLPPVSGQPHRLLIFHGAITLSMLQCWKKKHSMLILCIDASVSCSPIYYVTSGK